MLGACQDPRHGLGLGAKLRAQAGLGRRERLWQANPAIAVLVVRTGRSPACGDGDLHGGGRRCAGARRSIAHFVMDIAVLGADRVLHQPGVAERVELTEGHERHHAHRERAGREGGSSGTQLVHDAGNLPQAGGVRKVARAAPRQ